MRVGVRGVHGSDIQTKRDFSSSTWNLGPVK